MKAIPHNKKGSTQPHFSFGKRKSGAGFTLVETLVAITILLLALAAPMTIIAKGMKTAFHAREQTTAFYLAQESIEAVFALRDQDALDGSGTWDWLGSLGSCTGGSACGLDVNDSGTVSVVDCSSDGCRLRYEENSNARDRYNYTTGELSPYTREVRITETAAGREARIEATVSWSSGLFGGVKEVRLQTVIMNQYDWLN